MTKSAEVRACGREREEIISNLRRASLEEKYEDLSREIADIKAAIAEIRAKVS